MMLILLSGLEKKEVLHAVLQFELRKVLIGGIFLKALTGFIIELFYSLTGIEGKNIYGEDEQFLVARFRKTIRLIFSSAFRVFL